METADRERHVQAMRRRLEAMGLDWREGPGGGSLLVRLPVGPEPFEGGSEPWTAGYVVFATVGANRIKCLKPQALFHLPLVSIADCSGPEAIEGRIREAWRERWTELNEARAWLEKLGAGVAEPRLDPVLELPLALDDAHARGRVVRRGEVILPGRGPLSGIPLRRAEDRRFHPDPGAETATDLEIGLAHRLEELLRIEERMAREARLQAPPVEEPRKLASRARSHRVLLVGRRLCDERALADALRLRGYGVELARSSSDAMRAFEDASFELVVTDSDLGRYEGIEMIPGLRALAGIEEMPLVLVDEQQREERREMARTLGAAGYLVHPLDVEKIAPRLARIVESPRRRRFTRYPQRLAVSTPQSTAPELTAQVGRGGMLLVTDRDLPIRSVEPYTLELPHGAGRVTAEAEVVYRVRGAGLQHPGLGIRFHAFADEGEQILIRWLRSLQDPA